MLFTDSWRRGRVLVAAAIACVAGSLVWGAQASFTSDAGADPAFAPTAEIEVPERSYARNGLAAAGKVLPNPTAAGLVANRFGALAGSLNKAAESPDVDAIPHGVIADGRGGWLPSHAKAPVDAAVPLARARAGSIIRAAITSPAGTYRHRSVIEVSVTFDGTVTVPPGKEPRLAVLVGGSRRWAELQSGSSTTTVLVFEYEVQSSDRDDNGISVPTNALDGGEIKDVDRNDVDRTFRGLPADNRHLVDGRVWVTSKPTIDSTPVTDGRYTPPPKDAPSENAPGHQIDVAVTFSAMVHVVGKPALTLRIGRNDRQAVYQRGSGSARLLFRYRVQKGDLDLDGISVPANALTGRIADLVSDTAANLAVSALADAPGHLVDGVGPIVVATRVTTVPEKLATHKRGDMLAVEIEFDEDLNKARDLPTELRLSFDGTERRAQRNQASEKTNTLEFTYTVGDGDVDADGFVIQRHEWESEDRYDNTASTTIASQATPHRVDGVAPRVEQARIVSSAGTDGTYMVDDDIDIEVEFTEPVVVPDDSDFTLIVGDQESSGSTRTADYLSGSGTDRIRYRYTVVDGDTDTDGVSFRAQPLSPVTDLVGNIFADRVPAIAEQPNHRVVTDEDRVAPRVTGIEISSRPRGSAYGVGQDIVVTVTFSEPVEGAEGTTGLVLTLGSGSQTARLVGESNRSEELRFSYKVAANDHDANGVALGPLVGGPIKDLSGNAAVHRYELPDQGDHRVDGIAPEVQMDGVTITSEPRPDGFYAVGDAIEITVSFDEPVVARHTPDIRLPLDVGGTERLAILVRGDGEASWTFRYVVRHGDVADEGIGLFPRTGGEPGLTPSEFKQGEVQDLAGNALVDVTELKLERQAGHLVDARESGEAGVSVVSYAGTDDTYGIGDRIEVEVTFAEDVRVTGSPALVLTFASDMDEHGPVERVATLDRRGPRLLAFAYEVQLGDVDSDGLSIVADALVGATIVDERGNPAGAIGVLDHQSAHKVDGVAPKVLSFRIASDPGPDRVYGLNETLAFEIVFSEIVHITQIGGQCVLDVSIGQHTRTADYVGGSGTPVQRFEYLVQSDDQDDDGVSLAARPIRCPSPPDGPNPIADNADNPLAPRQQGLPAQPGHPVNGRVNEARLEIVSQPRQAGTYGPGEVIELSLRFSGRVNVEGDPRLVLSIGGREADAAFAGGSGTDTLRFRYLVRAEDLDGDGISVGPGALEGGRIVDTTGREVSRRFEPLPPSGQHRVDGVMPSVTGIKIVSSPIGDRYGAGEVIELKVTFAETVYVTGDGDEPVLLLGIGRTSRPASYVDGSGTTTLTFAYAVAVGDFDADGISVGPDALVRGVIEDVAGNNWGGAARRLPPLPPRSEHAVDAAVDALAPHVREVMVTSSPASMAYAEGEIIEVDVEFSERVHVTGSPRLLLAVGPETREAVFANGSGSSTLTFAYVVVAEDRDLDGIAIGPGPRGLTGGVIADGGGNEANRTFEGVPVDAEQRVGGRTDPVRIAVHVVSTPDSTAYRAGEPIDIDVTFFDTSIYVTGDPVLTLQIGGTGREALLVEGSGTPRLRFRYLVQSGDLDVDGISIYPDALTGGTLTRDTGVPVLADLPGVPAQGNQRVDARPARLDSVRIASLPGTYGVGDRIEVAVTFDEDVLVSGDPVLSLSVGGSTRVATFTGGGGTDTLVFAYEVVAGDEDDDGISVPTDALTGGVITDVAGNEADRGFRGLAAGPSYRVEGELVAVMMGWPKIVSEPKSNETYAVGEAIDVELTFGERVHVDGVPVVVLRVGASGRAAALTEGSGTSTLVFSYVVQAGDADKDGISIAANALTGGTITDESGRPVSYEVEALPASDGAGHQVDGKPALVEKVEITSGPRTYGAGDPIEVSVTFDEPVLVSGDPVFSLSVGGSTRIATLTGGGGTDTLVFTYEVLAGDRDDDGISVPADALTGGVITDVAGNVADLGFRGLIADLDHKVAGELVAVVGAPDLVSKPGTYTVGKNIDVAVHFSDKVYVQGDPVVVLRLGADDREAALVEGSGTSKLLFRYVVQSGDLANDGISIAANALTGGTITDGSGRPVSYEVVALAAVHGEERRVDGQPASVASVAIVEDVPRPRTYAAGDRIEVAVTFDEAVLVSGDPVLSLSVGGSTRIATLAGGGGTKKLVFAYEVVAGDRDDDGISVPADALTGGVITDVAGNVADRAFDGLKANDRHLVAGRLVAVRAPPDVISNPGPDRTYIVGDAIEVAVRFSDEVHVDGDPVLALRIGADDRQATLEEGSGTSTLVFRYVVQTGDVDEDGISIAANALTGGALSDSDGNPVDRRFAGTHLIYHKVGPELVLVLETVTAEVGTSARVDLVAALLQAGVTSYDGPFTAASDDRAVATVAVAAGKLIVVPRAVGETVVGATATYAPITIVMLVVVEANQAERAVLEGALAAVGRGLLSSSSSTVARRLEMAREGSRFRAPTTPGVSRLSGGGPSGSGGWRGVTGGARPAMGPSRPRAVAGHPGSMRDGGFAPWQQDLPGSGVQRPYGRLFSMDLAAGPGRPVSWGVWAGADRQTFDGRPDEGAYGGDLTSFHAGVDARGEGWVAGAAVTRSQADVSYEFGGRSGGEGTLGVKLTMASPYVQWTPTQDTVFWAMLGFGTGDAKTRGGDAASEISSALGARLGLVGGRMDAWRRGALGLALRGDGGAVALETDNGLQAVDGLRVNAQRLRAGLEASYAFDVEGGALTPFLDAGVRFDAGDGHTGGGVEISGGVRYRGPFAGLEVSARSLVLHGEEGVAEGGISATVFIEPDDRGRGWRLSFTPRHGPGGSSGPFDPWRNPAGRALARGEAAQWQFDGQVGYGFAVDRTGGTLTPFGELGARGRARTTRWGLAYEAARGRAPPLRLELATESTRSLAEGPGGVGVQLTAEARW